MRNVNKLLDLMSYENFLSNQTFYKIFPDLNIEPKEMPDTLAQSKEELDNFIRKNNYACRNNKLNPIP